MSLAELLPTAMNSRLKMTLQVRVEFPSLVSVLSLSFPLRVTSYFLVVENGHEETHLPPYSPWSCKGLILHTVPLIVSDVLGSKLSGAVSTVPRLVSLRALHFSYRHC